MLLLPSLSPTTAALSASSAAPSTCLQSMLTGACLARCAQVSRGVGAAAAAVPRFYTGEGSATRRAMAEFLTERGLVEWEQFCAGRGGLEDLALRKRCRTKINGRAPYFRELVRRVGFWRVCARLTFPFDMLTSRPRGGVMVSHLVGEWCLTHKDELGLHTARHWGDAAHAFHPESHIVECSPAKGPTFTLPRRVRDRVAAVARHGHGGGGSDDNNVVAAGRKASSVATAPARWILKPGRGSCGVGIELVDGSGAGADAAVAAVTQTLRTKFFNADALEAARAVHKPGSTPASATRPVPVVLQRYVDSPFLFDGRKFDIRVYLLVVSVKPLVAFYHDGYIRISGQDYRDPTRPDGDGPIPKARKAAHITNVFQQRDLSGYDAASDSVNGRKIRASFGDFLAAVGAAHDELWPGEEDSNGTNVGDKLRSGMKAVIAKALAAAEPTLVKACAGAGQYTLLGVDFLLARTGRLWLLEFTRGPKLYAQPGLAPPYIVSLHRGMLRATVGLLLEVQRRLRCGKGLLAVDAAAEAADEERPGGSSKGGGKKRGSSSSSSLEAFAGSWERIGRGI